MIFLILICSAVLLFILWWYKQYYHYFNTMWDIPKSPLTLPIVGDLLLATGADNCYFDLHKSFISDGNYKTLRGAMGFHFGIFTADPILIEFMTTNINVINKSPIYLFGEPWLGTGLLISSDEKWYTRRKLLTPAYHFKILGQFIDVFDKNATILIHQLRKETNEKLNIHSYISLCSLDIICETAMGTNVNAQLNSNSEYVTTIRKLSRVYVDRTLNVLKHPDFLFRLTRDYKIEQKALKVLHGYTLSVINSRREKLVDSLKNKNKDESHEEIEDLETKKKIPFLDLLLQTSLNGQSLSDEDIREEVDTFMFEGHDTVSAALSFCIYCLSTHPEVQTNVIIEQKKIFGNVPHRDTTLNDLGQMKYLEMVIKETMRLYPSVPIFGRIVTEDIQYKNYVFKKGLEFGVSAYTLHRNPEIYPDPDCFDPLRFAPDVQAQRHPFAYIPFSAGFRNCIGQKFAMFEMKSVLSRLLRNYVFLDSGEKLLLKSGAILTSANGMIVGIKPRQW